MFLKAAIGLVILLGLALAWQVYKVQGLEKALVVATVKQEAAETSLRTAEQERQLVETQFDQFTTKSVQIEKERNEARADVDKVRIIFEDHDFANLLTRKPEAVTRLMIKKTREVFDEIEALTAD